MSWSFYDASEIDWRRVEHRIRTRSVKFETVEEYIARGGVIDNRKRTYEELLESDRSGNYKVRNLRAWALKKQAKAEYARVRNAMTRTEGNE